MREMQSYCGYLYRLVEPALGRRVWEIGAGHANYTSLLRRAGKTVLATDIDQKCLEQARERFPDDSGLTLAHVDLRDESSVRRQAAFRADSIMCLNVLEHIEDDVSALRWLRESVTPDARLGLIVPAMPALFGKMDAEAGHFRRYSRSALRGVLEQAGWSVQTLRYVNLLGALGWWYHNRVRKNAGLGDAAANVQMRAVDRWLPLIASWTDPCFGTIAGLSVLALAAAGRGSAFSEVGSS